MTNEERIQRKEELEAEIKKLKAELKEIKVNSIAELCKQPMYMVLPDRNGDNVRMYTDRVPANVVGWEELRALAMRLLKPRYATRRGKVKDFSPEEVQTCADFCNEVIPIWNKYMEKIYGEAGSDTK